MTLPLLVSLVGLTSCVLVISINFLTATRTNRMKIKKRIDLVLIYIRCILDVFVGFSVVIYIAVIELKTLNVNKVNVKTTYFVVFSSLPSALLWPIRFFLSICIAVWRIVCLARPQFAESSGLKVVCSIVIISSVSIGITEVVVFFLGCSVKFTAHPGCMALACMAGPCFITYSTINRMILFSLAFICALVFAILICFCETKETREKRIVETDYWFLLCMFNTTVFDCIPFAITLIAGTDFSSNNFGPFVNTLNMLGACFDAVVVSKIFETHQFL
ncbi:unnamed protein product [Caenorhabditis brenneri]